MKTLQDYMWESTIVSYLGHSNNNELFFIGCLVALYFLSVLVKAWALSTNDWFPWRLSLNDTLSWRNCCTTLTSKRSPQHAKGNIDIVTPIWHQKQGMQQRNQTRRQNNHKKSPVWKWIRTTNWAESAQPISTLTWQNLANQFRKGMGLNWIGRVKGCSR